MKAWRQPEKSWGPQPTDEKTMARLIKLWDWRPGKTIWFNGTVDKTGSRGTEFGVEVSADDISAMQQVLVRHYKSMTDDVKLLEDALRKVCSLAFNAKAPSDAERLDALEEIADHFLNADQRKDPFKPSLKLKWLKWKRL